MCSRFPTVNVRMEMLCDGNRQCDIELRITATLYSTPLSDCEKRGRLEAGEYIGELGLITSSPRAFTLKSLTHAHIFEMPGDSLIRLLKSDVALNRYGRFEGA